MVWRHTLGTEGQPVNRQPDRKVVIPARPELSPGRGGDHPHIGMICVWQTARATCSLAAPSRRSARADMNDNAELTIAATVSGIQSGA